MKNPYTKTAKDKYWENASFYPASEEKLRWLHFKNTGCLWMSSRGIKYRHQHPRDYIQPILERYVRRFGYANADFFDNAYRHIQEKHNWHSTAHRHVPQLNQYGRWAEGEFCPVDFENPEKECPLCGGSNGYLYSPVECGGDESPGKYDVSRIWNLDGNYRSDYYQLRQHQRYVGFRCKDESCNDVQKFLQRNDEICETAKDLNVARKIPVKQIKAAQTRGEAFLLAASAMLDFEARVTTRINNEVK